MKFKTTVVYRNAYGTGLQYAFADYPYLQLQLLKTSADI